MTSRPGSAGDGARESAHASMSGPTARTSRWMLLAETEMPAESARLSEACR